MDRPWRRRGDRADRNRDRLLGLHAATAASPQRWAERFRGVNAWLLERLVLRLALRPRRSCARSPRSRVFCNKVIERFVVDGIVTGTTGAGARRRRSACARMQSGLARAYALSLIGGTTLVALYFLVVANDEAAMGLTILLICCRWSAR